jgi:hypothetical protein
MASTWVALLTVCALPTLVLFRPGRGWLRGSPFSHLVWAALGVAAVIGALGLGDFLPTPTAARNSILVATPLLQGVVFVSLDWLFRMRFRRAPVTYGQARYGHTPQGKIYWADRLFWLAVLLVLTIGGVVLCHVVGIKLPSGYGAS